MPGGRQTVWLWGTQLEWLVHVPWSPSPSRGWLVLSYTAVSGQHSQGWEWKFQGLALEACIWDLSHIISVTFCYWLRCSASLGSEDVLLLDGRSCMASVLVCNLLLSSSRATPFAIPPFTFWPHVFLVQVVGALLFHRRWSLCFCVLLFILLWFF